jgi:hypothetical protein
MISISYVDSNMSNSSDMLAQFDERRQHMQTDTGQFEHNLCDAVGCSIFHIVVVGSILSGIIKTKTL